MFVDLPLDELRAYRPEVAQPEDFDSFWQDQIATARDIGGAAAVVPVATPVRSAQVYDVTFPGYAGDPIKGWLQVPLAVDPNAPFVVEFVGYNGGRGDPLEWLTWPSTGTPHFVMDSRGQGGGWRTADTADPHDAGRPSTNGYMTRGIESPASYYFTRLFVDAVRAVDAVRDLPVAAGRRLVTAGGSQGGALSILAAAWHPDVAATMPDVPFLCHPRRAVDVTDSRPYGELAQWCALRPDAVDATFATLSYVDIVNHAQRADVPALFSVALRDDIAPASTVFAAYNRYAGPKDIAVYEFNDHSGGGPTHRHRQVAFLQSL